MKKLLLILAISTSFNCIAQKADTVEYCSVGLTPRSAFGAGDYYVRLSKGDGNSYEGLEGKWKYEIEPIAKLGTQGWDVVTRYSTDGGGCVYLLRRRKR